MKKLTSIFFALVFCAVSLSAQISTSSNADDWKSFSGSDEEFTVEAPASFHLFRFPSLVDKNAPRVYKSFAGGTYLFIVSSDENQKLSPYNLLSRYAETNKAKISDVNVDSFNGKMFSFTDADGFYQKIVAVKARERFYIFHAVSGNENSTDAERFLNSIRLDKTLPTPDSKNDSTEISNGVEKQQSNQEKSATQANNNSGIGTGRGSGIGIGSGSGANSTNQNTFKSANQNSALKILSKPSPSYTQLARFYEISGSVQLRVVFLDNGQIGSVSPVTKLPLGLTANAISTARSLRFEPAVKNGVAVSVTKSVVYTFTIY